MRRMKRIIVLGLVAVMLAVTLCGCGFEVQQAQVPPRQSGESSVDDVRSPTVNYQRSDSELSVHFLDVGQADSILVILPDRRVMLVDGGNNADGPVVVKYLERTGIKRIHYLVGTHPHEDHIGGLDDVIEAFEVEKVYMPRVAHNTRTYEDVLTAIKARNLKVTPARAGLIVLDDPGLQIEFLAPGSSDYKDLNQYSAVIKITYINCSILLTGDAGFESEEEMIASGADLEADVLKVGHHGSRYSTSEEFLEAVSPVYAVISCGKDNDYGHPHEETISRLAGQAARILRTDRDGTVIITCDGQDLQVKTGQSSGD